MGNDYPRTDTPVDGLAAAKWLFSRLSAAGRWRVPVAILLGAIAGAIEYAEAMLFGRAIASLASWTTSSIGEVLILSGTWLLLGLISTAAASTLVIVGDEVVYRAREEIWSDFISSELGSSDGAVSQAHSGQRLRAAFLGTDAAYDMWAGITRAHAPAAIGLVLLVPLCIWLNWILATALLAVLLLSTMVSVFALRKSYSAQSAVEDIQGRAAGRAADVLRNSFALRAFGTASKEADALRNAFESARLRQMAVGRLWAIVAGSARMSSALAVAFVLSLGTVLYGNGWAGLSEVVTFVGFATLATGRIDMLLHFAQQVSQRLPAVAELARYVPVDRIKSAPAVQVLQCAPKFSRACALTLRGVHFSYRSGTEVLRGIDIDITAGETLAIIGASGAGKSTLLSLILGFQKPTSGQILVDGRDLHAMDTPLWRARIGMVFQESFLLNRSVEDNIRLGKPEASFAEIDAICQELGMDQFIAQMPDGYATLVEENGMSLSGGQRQRLTLARALLRQPDLFLLDEPTSALDGVTEAMVQRVLRRLRGRATTIIIAHRLSTIATADRIVVLEDGVVAEVGIPSAMLAQSCRLRTLLGVEDGALAACRSGVTGHSVCTGVD